MAYGDGYAGGYSGVTGLSVTVEVAFATDPGDTPVWDDVTPYLRQFTVHRGRADELSAFSPGQATIVLTNEDRRFDPTYTSSPYSPNVVPMRRIRVRAVYSGTTYDVFNGYVTNWRQTYQPPQAAECAVEATDAFKVLANVELPGSVYEREVRLDLPGRWWRLGEPSGSTVALDQSAVPINGTYEGGVSLGQAGGPVHDPDTAAGFDGVDAAVTFGNAPVIVLFPYTIELWVKISDRTGIPGSNVFFSQGRSTIGGTATRPKGWVTGSDVGDPGKVVFDSITSSVRVDDDAWHHVVLTAQSAAAGQQTLYIDGASQGTGTAGTLVGNELLLGHPDYASAAFSWNRWPGQLDEFAYYSYVLTSGRVSAHNDAGRIPWRDDLTGIRIGRILDAAGWPAADRNIDAGTSTLQSADLGSNALAALQEVAQTEFGALFVTAAGLVRFVGRDSLLKAPYTTSQATFGDTGSDLEFGDLAFEYDDKLIYNEAQVSRANGTVQTVSDTTSQTRYLRRTKVVDGLLHQDDSTSRDAANWLVNHYKDPILRITEMRLEPSAGNETTHFPQVLARELLDRVTVKRTPQNLGATISQDAQIQGITHTVTAMQWVTQWNLSPAETQPYWILGTAGFSELGQTTRLGF